MCSQRNENPQAWCLLINTRIRSVLTDKHTSDVLIDKPQHPCPVLISKRKQTMALFGAVKYDDVINQWAYLGSG